jgi:hypothetical protein
MLFRLSRVKNKKYDVWVPTLDKWISFGDKRYAHYKTSSTIPAALHVYAEHRDAKRRDAYRKRAGNIRDASGRLTVNNMETENFYA